MKYILLTSLIMTCFAVNAMESNIKVQRNVEGITASLKRTNVTKHDICQTHQTTCDCSYDFQHCERYSINSWEWVEGSMKFTMPDPTIVRSLKQRIEEFESHK